MIVTPYLFSVVFFFVLTLCLAFVKGEDIEDNGWMSLRAVGVGEDGPSPALLVVISCIPIIRLMVCLLLVIMSKYSTSQAHRAILEALDEMENSEKTRELREEVEDFFRRY